MITHYGLFWSERDVFWGRQNNPGQLRGRVRIQRDQRGAPTREERDNAEEDFRDYVGVYCLYGGGDLLYIGEAGLGTRETLFNRLKTHREGQLSGLWNKFSWFGRKRYKKKKKTGIDVALRQLEAISIAIVNPSFNKRYGTFRNADEVLQVPHEQAEGDMEAKLARMADDIVALRQEIK